MRLGSVLWQPCGEEEREAPTSLLPLDVAGVCWVPGKWRNGSLTRGAGGMKGGGGCPVLRGRPGHWEHLTEQQSHPFPWSLDKGQAG